MWWWAIIWANHHRLLTLIRHDLTPNAPSRTQVQRQQLLGTLVGASQLKLAGLAGAMERGFEHLVGASRLVSRDLGRRSQLER